jgi:hypothetical protein
MSWLLIGGMLLVIGVLLAGLVFETERQIERRDREERERRGTGIISDD